MKKVKAFGLMSTSILALTFGMVVHAQDVTNTDNNLSTCLSGSESVCKLTENVTVSSQIEVTRNVTIDLNGHTITSNDSTASDYVLVFDIADGSFTITDTSGNTGSIVNTAGRGVKVEQGTLTVSNVTISSNDRTVQVNPQQAGQKAEFILESGKIVSTNTTSKTRTIFLWGDNTNASSAKVTINGGEVVAPINVKDSAAINLGSTGASGTELVINGGTITGYNGVRLYGDGSKDENTKFTMNDGTITAVGSGVITSHDNTEIYLYGGTITAQDQDNQANVGGDAVAVNHDKAGKLVIGKEDGTGPTVTGETGVAIQDGDITIQGGDITATGEYRENPTKNDDGTEDTGAAVSVTTTSNDKKPKVNITGGKITSENGNAYYEGVAEGRSDVTSQVTESITGGEFIAAEGKDSVVSTKENFISGGTFSSNVMEYAAQSYGQSQSGVVGVVHKVNIKESENGTITANTDAAEDEEVTITVTPKDGYKLGELVVTDADGNTVKVTNGKFVMPKSDVTITATFVKADNTNPNTYDAGLTYVGLALAALGLGTISIKKLRNN